MLRAPRGLLFPIRGHVLDLDHPWRASAKLASLYDAAPNHAQRRHDAHIHNLRRRFQAYLAPLGPLAIAIDGNAVVIAEGADPRFGPTVAATGRLSGAIEEPRDLLVGHQARQLADQRQRVFGHCPAMLAGSIHLQLQRGVVSARQCRTISMRPLSMRTTTSYSAARKILLRVAAVAAGCDQASSRSAASCSKCRRSFSPKGAGFLASSAATSPSSRHTTCSASFQRRSSSPATKRLSGSTASYCRRACAAEKRACCSARSSCLWAANVSLV